MTVTVIRCTAWCWFDFAQLTFELGHELFIKYFATATGDDDHPGPVKQECDHDICHEDAGDPDMAATIWVLNDGFLSRFDNLFNHIFIIDICFDLIFNIANVLIKFTIVGITSKCGGETQGHEVGSALHGREVDFVGLQNSVQITEFQNS